MNWVCDFCDADNFNYGSCVTEGCNGRYDRQKPKEKKVPQANAAVHKIEVPKFKTIYDVIFALVAQGAILTGSRAFGFETPESDWDFVISSERVGLEGIWEAFVGVDNNAVENTYKDRNTAQVLQHASYKIHVQVSRDIKQKLEAQDLLLSMPPVMKEVLLKKLGKTAQRRVWDWALQQVGGKN